MDENYEAVERARIIAASQSGGSAKPVESELPGQLKFGESTFGGTTELRDDEGNLLMAHSCEDPGCIGSHIWGKHWYCSGPE